MPNSENWSIGRLLQWTTEYLKRHGADNPRLDAEVLLAASLDCQRIQLYTAYEDVPDEAVRTRFRDLVRRRSEGVPVAYLVGHREFFSLMLQVTPDVLIPRPETEFLVMSVLDRLKTAADSDRPVQVADVGTGSGNIAIALACHAPSVHVTAIDISESALAVARANVRQHGVADRVQLVQGDLLETLPAEPLFDFVVSNPPYVTEAEYDGLVRDVRDYEPRGALVGGATGSELIARLLPQAAQRLRGGGWFLCEISPSIEPAVQRLLTHDPNFHPPIIRHDLARLPRVLECMRR